MICMYHSSDLDGRCSAAIVKRAHPECTMYPINYGDRFPWERVHPDSQVIMADFSLQPFKEMERLNNSCSLVWIDHHKTAIEEEIEYWKTTRKSIKGCRRDGTAACILCWEFFFPREKMPEGVRLLGEFDVWNHSDPNTIFFQYGMRCYENDDIDNDIWMKVLNDPSIDLEILEKGHAVAQFLERDNRLRAQTLCFTTVLDGIRLLAANYGPGSSQFFDGKWDPDKYDAMCLFFWKRNKWTVSLYTDKEGIDCGAVCKARGGGGHRGAAGFQCQKLPFEELNVVSDS